MKQIGRFLRLSLLGAAWPAMAQMPIAKLPSAPAAPPESADHTIRIPVHVETNKGAPVPGLKQSDFTVLDNNHPVQITSFAELNAAKQQVEAILVLDVVNATFESVTDEKDGVANFLRNTGPKLPLPMAVAVLTSEGIRVNKGFTQDTAAMIKLVDAAETSLGDTKRGAGYWEATERFETSVNGLGQLAQYATTLPGRKLILWMSPGWPLLPGPEVDFGGKLHQKLFEDVVSFSALMRRGNITLDSLDPLGSSESLSRQQAYGNYTRDIKKPNDSEPGNLGLQVIALHSGGLVLNSNDVAAEISRAISDAQDWYELEFKPSPDHKPGEFHRLEVRVNRPGVQVRTTHDYYEPLAAGH
jgi:VWFA-related protein